ncbi:MAG: phosphohistidine phosphatase SixA [Thermodesulfobacteriota bacterium]
MEIYLVQHGEALPEEKDPERGLSPEGEDNVRHTGKALSKLGIKPDLIISSPKKRSKQTASIIAREVGYPEGRIEVSERLKPLAPPGETVEYLRQFSDRNSIILAGHLPSLAEVASFLLTEKGKARIKFVMGGVGRIDVLELSTRKGILSWYLVPQQLRLIAGG